ncbi:hypothetical protein BC629DRAFT_1439053 [Irpex lacteus]|nr:hypothetical protein BC629DRAFT_1439053 [Irpex lacteus]
MGTERGDLLDTFLRGTASTECGTSHPKLSRKTETKGSSPGPMPTVGDDGLEFVHRAWQHHRLQTEVPQALDCMTLINALETPTVRMVRPTPLLRPTFLSGNSRFRHRTQPEESGELGPGYVPEGGEGFGEAEAPNVGVDGKTCIGEILMMWDDMPGVNRRFEELVLQWVPGGVNKIPFCGRRLECGAS